MVVEHLRTNLLRHFLSVVAEGQATSMPVVAHARAEGHDLDKSQEVRCMVRGSAFSSQPQAVGKALTHQAVRCAQLLAERQATSMPVVALARAEEIDLDMSQEVRHIVCGSAFSFQPQAIGKALSHRAVPYAQLPAEGQAASMPFEAPAGAEENDLDMSQEVRCMVCGSAFSSQPQAVGKALTHRAVRYAQPLAEGQAASMPFEAPAGVDEDDLDMSHEVRCMVQLSASSRRPEAKRMLMSGPLCVGTPAHSSDAAFQPRSCCQARPASGTPQQGQRGPGAGCTASDTDGRVRV